MASVIPGEGRLESERLASRLALVVVVDPIVLTTLSAELHQAGFRVAEGADAEEAIAHYAAEIPAVVIANYCPPYMTGAQVSA